MYCVFLFLVILEFFCLLPLSSMTFDPSVIHMVFSWRILTQFTCLYCYINEGEWLSDASVDSVNNLSLKVVQKLMINIFKQMEEKVSDHYYNLIKFF